MSKMERRVVAERATPLCEEFDTVAGSVTSGTDQQRIVIIGAGPAGLGYLERLLSNIPEMAPQRLFDVHVVDPHPPGPGRIWRYDQAPELQLNSQAYDITIFPDRAFTGEGPKPAGDASRLTFLGWLRRVRAGDIPLPFEVDDRIRTEIASVRPETFPTRRLMALYLGWAYEHVVGEAPDNVHVTAHRASALAVNGDGPSNQHVVLDNGYEITSVTSVIYTLGHSERESSLEEREATRFAQENDLVYVAPQPASAEFLTAIAPGSNVLIRGTGLTSSDTITLLTEHRGGSYAIRDDGKLFYQPSWQEPRIFLGSRKGVPLHTVPSVPLKGDKTAPLYFTLAKAREIADSTPAFSFKKHFWPLIARDLTRRVYAELFVAHPEKVACDWAEFAAKFDATPWASDQYDKLVQDTIAAPEHQLDFQRLSYPLGKSFQGSLAEYQESITDYVTRNLWRHRNDSTTTALRMALRDAQYVIAMLRAHPNWDADSLVDEVYNGWYPFFCSIAIGPSQETQEKLLALMAVGIVTFLGPEISVELDGHHSCFVGRSAVRDAYVEAAALVDARIAVPTMGRSANPALRSLAASGGGMEASYGAFEDQRSTGRVRVSQPGNFIVDAGGQVNFYRQALGAFVHGNWVSAFALPESDFPFFRQTDAMARATLEVLAKQANAKNFALLP
ncbi:FAD/NAD(P)-binding protein [Mesorhizobium sp. DCY119]|uniref:FAD/NAD(P)-binding protein n=1 Tax=Mesorhizobium sp. DCY119 TaxID=2108445 RepID=UPI000E712F0E|nr:FAD/NAD(P)-binding protein [Mesorhizobium sp. DCY119]RJG40539.1 hypothetical protein D3Y55_24960 [Mesorhizobium sp. DCY119]